MTAPISVKDVNRGLRTVLWPVLKAAGFSAHTDRIAWLDTPGGVGLVETWSVGSAWDGGGCTSFSFSAMAAVFPAEMASARTPSKDGLLRPHYWHCTTQLKLQKGLAQPWFRPFAGPPQKGMVRSLLEHREGLQKVIRKDVHDRPDVWFVREDGSNLDECLADLVAVVTASALPWIGTRCAEFPAG